MFRFVSAAILVSCVFGAGAAPLLPVKTRPVTVLTALPVTQMIADTLAKGTTVSVLFAGPTGGTLSDLARHLEGNADFARLARKADAVVTVRGAWPVDPLFPAARAINIRVVEIDAVEPVEPGRVGIGVVPDPGHDGQGVLLPHVWTSPANVAKMADIVAADLARLVPKDAADISANLAGLKADLFALRTQAQNRLLEVEIPEVVSLSAPFYYLFQDLGIHVSAWSLDDSFRWTPAEQRAFRERVEQLDVPAVVTAFPLDETLQESLSDAGVHVAVLNPLEGMADKGGTTLAVLRANLDHLLAALEEPPADTE